MDQEDNRMIDPWYPSVLILVVLICLCFARLILGPTPADRVVAVDTVNTLTVASLVILGLIYQEVIFIDVAIVYALLSFVSTLYIAKYLGGEL
jgi:multicomponent Na+:H+ antiporter subunit F